MKPLPFEKRVPGQRVVFVSGDNEYHGVIIPFPDSHPLKEIHERERDLIYVQADSCYYWLNNKGVSTWWDFNIETHGLFTSPLYAEEDYTG